MFCTKCGNKLSDNAKFCSKCGNATSLYKKEREVLTEERRNIIQEKILLFIGTILVITASIIFAYANWNDLSGIFKILFLSIESLLFLSLSIFSKKINFDKTHKLFWFIGITFIPIILNVIPIEKILGDYYSYSGNGIYVYLAISSFICAIIYYLSGKSIKFNLLEYISFELCLLTITFILYAFHIDNRFIFIILSEINLLTIICYSFIKNESLRNKLCKLTSFNNIIFGIYTCIYFQSIHHKYLLIGIIGLISIISFIIVIFKKDEKNLIYVYPFIMYLLISLFSYYLFDKSINVSVFCNILLSIFIYFILCLSENKALKIISYLLMINSILVCLVGLNYKSLFVVSIILFVINLFIININKNQVEEKISKFILPFNILLFIYSLSKYFISFDVAIIYLITSIVCYIVYMFFKQKNNDKYLKNLFEVFSYILLGFSSIIIIFENINISTFILNEFVWICYYIFNSVLKENKNKVLNIILLLFVIINFIIGTIIYSISSFYSLLLIGLLLSLLDLFKKDKSF